MTQDCFVSAAGSGRSIWSAQMPASALSAANDLVSSITYFLTAYDGVNTSTSQIISLVVTRIRSQTVGQGGGIILVPSPDGGQTTLEIPPGAISFPTEISATTLDRHHPSFKAALDPNIDLTSKPDGKPLAIYEFQPEGTRFNLPLIVKLYYPPTTIDRDKLKVFLREGNRWVTQGGKANDSNQIVFRLTHFSKYAIFPAKPSVQLTTDKKFITPNSDGRNDSATWPESVKQIKLYDVSGLQIWQGHTNEFARNQLGDVIEWNGTDQDGKTVESGAYIYKAESVMGESSYGVIIVIR